MLSLYAFGVPVNCDFILKQFIRFYFAETTTVFIVQCVQEEFAEPADIEFNDKKFKSKKTKGMLYVNIC